MKNFVRLYKIMLNHWPYLLIGLFFMIGFAFFSGISITMVVPLFDDVFIPNKPNVQIVEFQQFFNEFKLLLDNTFHSMLDINMANLEKVKDGTLHLFEISDSYLLLKIIGLFTLVLMLLKNIFFLGYKWMFINLQGRTVQSIRDLLFDTYLKQSLAFFGKNRIGDSLVRMINDVDKISRNLIISVVRIVKDIFLIVVYIIIALYINFKLFLIGMIIFPVFAIAVSFMGKKIKKYAKRIQSQFANMFSIVEEVLANMIIVKAFGKEESEYQKFRAINKKHFKFWRKARIYKSFNTPLGELLSTVSGVTVLLIGGIQVVNETNGFTFGNFTAFLFALFSIMHPIKNITKAYTSIKKAIVSLDRVSEILDLQPEIVNSENPVIKGSFENKIEFKNVYFSYNNNTDVIKDFNLIIHKGERIAFVGSSGAGKSTVVNLLSRMYDVTKGKILIDDIPLKEIEINSLRKLFGTVTQDTILFTATIKHNIEYGGDKDISKNEIYDSLEIANASEFVEKLPYNIDEHLHSKGSSLSGGQKQRLCIARAIVGNPPILIFDEATSALDTESERKVQNAIEKATENRTVFMIAHRLSTVLSADKIVVMEDGEIVGVGKHKELLYTSERYKYLYSLQFGEEN
ncbi:MAG: ABC transporter ATP-binding protein [Candidatus Cloacimonadota bacterium]|nr:ABC transporter ATP-binding protein [Candidatus Cloacimonadota bacterium]